MAYYKKYYYTFRDLKNSKYTVEIHEDIDTQMTYNTYVIAYTNKNYIYVTGDISIYGIGDSLDNIGSGIPNGAIVTGIDVGRKWVFLNATATTSNSPALATLHKAVPVPEQVRVGNNPFTIEYPEIDNKFQPVKGCGFSFNLLSDVNMKFIGLSTADMQKYMVKLIEEVWVTPIYSVDITRFIGYLNSEIYEEPFESIDNYLVNFSGNNGFSLLERLNYVGTLGNKYDTIGSYWTALYNIFYKVGLPYKKLYVGLSTTIDGITIPESETILHHLFINPDNWYNEDGEAESTRTVLEKILGVLSASIITVDDNVYITDLNFLLGSADDNRSFKVFDMQNDFIYMNTSTLSVNIGDLSEIGFADGVQDYQIASGINKQVIKYNNYKQTDIVNYEANKDTFYEQLSVEPVNVNADYKYDLIKYNKSKFWNEHNGSNFIVFAGTGTENLANYEGGMRIAPKSDTFAITPEHLSFNTKIDLPYLINSDEYKLKLEAVIHPHTWAYFGLAPQQQDLAENEFIISIRLHAEIIIDNEIGTKKKYYNPNYQWVNNAATSQWVDIGTPNTDAEFYFSKPTKYILEKDNDWRFKWEYEAINDKDAELQVWRKAPKSYTDDVGNIVYDMKSSPYYISLEHGVSGRLSINLYDYELRFLDFSGNEILPNGYTIPNWFNLYIKEFKLTVVDKFDNTVKKLDVEIVGYSKNSPLNSIYKDEGDEVTNYLGSNAGNYPADNSNLLKLNSGGYYEPCDIYTRQGKSDMIEFLQLRSIISNYNKQYIKLSATTNRLEKLVGFLTYNNYLSGKRFTITGLTRNIADASDELLIQESTEDNVDINYYPYAS